LHLKFSVLPISVKLKCIPLTILSTKRGSQSQNYDLKQSSDITENSSEFSHNGAIKRSRIVRW